MKKALDDLPQVGHRVLALDMIKGLCIVMVIITHVPLTTEIKRAVLYPFTILPAVPMFLMCSVYAFCLTEDRKNGDFWSWFSNDIFWKRANRFLFPYFIAIGILIAGLFATGTKSITLSSFLQILFQGGRGPGAYYVIVILQLLIIFPFLRSFYKQNPCATILVLMAVTILYETLCQFWKLDQKVYSILIFKYLTHLALGFLLYYFGHELKKTVIPFISIIIGGIYLVGVYYLGYKQVLTYQASMQSVIPAIYSFGALYYLFRLEDWLQKTQHWLQPLFYTGKASFHIMLTQMVYFYFARLAKFESKFDNLLIVIVVDLTISITAGCLFYWADGKARDIFTKVRKKEIS